MNTTQQTNHQMLLNRIVKILASLDEFEYKQLVKAGEITTRTVGDWYRIEYKSTLKASKLFTKWKEDKITTTAHIVARATDFVNSISASFELPENLLELVHEKRTLDIATREHKLETELIIYAEEVYEKWLTKMDFVHCPSVLKVLGTEITLHDDTEDFVLYKKDLEVFLRKARITQLLAELA